MNKFSLLLFAILILSALSSCGNIPFGYLLTKADKQTITNYLDTNTTDIITPTYGTVFSAYELLGTENNKVYIWTTLIEFEKRNNEIILRQAVSLPIVLSISKNNSGITINSHKYPDDGINYGKSRDRLFPEKIIHSFPDNEARKKLEDETQRRAEAELLPQINGVARSASSFS